jgi:hypothetical protein
MAKTLRFGSNSVSSRINDFAVRRRTPASYGRLQELAAADFARHVAWDVTPQLNRGKLVTRPVSLNFVPRAQPFGKRKTLGPCENCCPEGQCLHKNRS